MEGLLPEKDSKPAFLHTNSSRAGWVGRAAEQWLPAAPSDSSMSWPGPRAVLAWKECRDCSQIRCEQQQPKRKELVWVGCGHCELGQDGLEQGWEGGSLYTSPFPSLGRRLLSSKRNKGTKHRDPAGATAQGGVQPGGSIPMCSWDHPSLQQSKGCGSAIPHEAVWGLICSGTPSKGMQIQVLVEQNWAHLPISWVKPLGLFEFVNICKPSTHPMCHGFSSISPLPPLFCNP